MKKNEKSNNNSNNIVAVLLKFKDKGTEDTVKAHTEILNNKKHVWWGWWSKDFENLPQKQLDEIINQLGHANGSVTFYLFHTKKEELYKAKCEEIMYRVGGLQCPDENSPSYYKDYPIKVWFNFSEIHQTNLEDFCNKYSFLEDDLIDEEHKDKLTLSSFAGYRASDPDLFIFQKRTIWFLRTARRTDIPIDTKQFAPMIDSISKNYFKTSGARFLLLSDLHFTTINNKHAFSLKNNPSKIKLIDAVNSVLKRDAKALSGIIISGDFTWCAKPDEFAYAKQFIMELMETYDIKRNQLVVVPGNHDIAFLKDGETWGENEKPTLASEEAQANYIKFYNDLFQTRPKEDFLCMARRLLLSNNLPVDIIGLDSNVLQQYEKAFVGQGFVGFNQLNYLATQMELKANENMYSYRILVLHHHLTPAWYQEEPVKDHSYSVLLDSGRVQAFIKKYRIKLVIHGHNHENQFIKITIPSSTDSQDDDYVYHIIGMGSAGACGGSNNVIGLLDFDQIGKISYSNIQINSRGQEDLPIKKYEILI